MGFLQDLTGASARKDLKRAKAASDAELQAGYDESQPFFNEAFDLYSPYAEGGAAANARYNQLLGLGTAEERVAGQQTYLDDPIFQSILGQESNALLRQQNARGQTYGGKTRLLGGRLGLEGYNRYLDRLSGQGQTGLAATGAQAGIRAGQGDLRYGFGATKAGHETSFGNAMAENRNTGINNLLNIAGTAAKVYAASDIRLKRNIEQVGTLPSGLPVYEFEYVWGPERHVGVMAHEAETIYPEAIARNENGYSFVDYSQIG